MRPIAVKTYAAAAAASPPENRHTHYIDERSAADSDDDGDGPLRFFKSSSLRRPVIITANAIIVQRQSARRSRHAVRSGNRKRNIMPYYRHDDIIYYVSKKTGVRRPYERIIIDNTVVFKNATVLITSRFSYGLYTLFEGYGRSFPTVRTCTVRAIDINGNLTGTPITIRFLYTHVNNNIMCTRTWSIWSFYAWSSFNSFLYW